MKETGDLLVTSNINSQTSNPRIRLEFLDGLRGFAAFYVLLFHIHLRTNLGDLPSWFQAIQGKISYGHYSVCVFIVLSGFCLMLPIAKSSTGELRGGLKDFIRRRARRILPPYFAALVFSFAWVMLFEGMKQRAGHSNSLQVERSMGNILSHLSLVFNWFPAYWGATNGSLWSVATEWQIYFVFALLLLPFWKRFGSIATVILAFVVGVGPHYLLPVGSMLSALDLSCAWFITLFAIGMAGATVRFGGKAQKWSPRFPWGICLTLTVALLALLIVIYKPVDNPWSPQLIRNYTWSTDLLCGLATLCLIMFCSYNVDSFMVKILQSPLAIALGGFSYSLYLVHAPILTALQYVIWHTPFPDLGKALLMWGLGIFTSVGLAFLFSRIFELPFISSPQQDSRGYLPKDKVQ